MKHIKSLEIVNFQSHKNSFISFEDGLNVISGPSDNGKSAIIRALKWVLYNEPKGTEFIRQGETGCRVSIVLSDDTTIVRERTKTKNQYRVIYKSGEEKIFEGFGNEIPEEVLRAHGITRLFIDASSSQSINLSEQLEGPFLLSQPGSVKAKAIGRLVGVHIVDEAIKDVSRDLSGHAGEERNINSNLEYISEKLKEFDSLNKRKEEIDRKESIINEVIEKNQRLKRLKEISEILLENQKAAQIMTQLLSKLKELEFAENILEKSMDKIRLQKLMDNLRLKYDSVDREMEYSKYILKKTSELHRATEIVSAAAAKNTLLDNLKLLYERLIKCNQEISSMESIIGRLKELDNAKNAILTLDNNINRVDKLLNAREQYWVACERIKKGEEYIRKFDGLQNAEKELQRTVVSLQRLDDLLLKRDKLRLIIANIEDSYKDIEKLEEEMSEDIKEYMGLLKAIGKCPVCMSPIEEHTVDQIINEFKGEN